MESPPGACRNGISTIHADPVVFGIHPIQCCVDQLKLEQIELVDLESDELLMEDRRGLQGVGRVRARTLHNAGFKTIEDLRKARRQSLLPFRSLEQIGKKIKEQAAGSSSRRMGGTKVNSR